MIIAAMLLVFAQLVVTSAAVSAQTLLVQNDAAKQETTVQQQTPAQAAQPNQIDQIELKQEPTGVPAPGATIPQEGPSAAEAPDTSDVGGIDPKKISAGPTLVFDAATGEVLSEKRAGENWYPASLTKLMTAYVVFKKIRSGQMKLDQQLSVSKLAARQPASRVGTAAGSTVTTDLALQALLVYSANDMAYVLAENASGSVARFAKDMNAAAQAIGMTSSYFVNPNGLYDPRQIITARDLGLLARALLTEFPEYNHYYGAESVDIGRRRLFNRNILIRLMEEADGMKTGFVCDSGFNLVATAKRGERRLVAVVLGAKSGHARAILAKDMLEQGFATSPLAQAPKVSEIVDQPIGLYRPADMTAKVCRAKEIAEIADPTILAGWGVSFGLRETAREADDALHRNMLMATGFATPGYGATYRPTDNSGFIPLLWGMDQASAKQACDKYRFGGISCSVVPEELIELYGTLHTARLNAVKASKPVARIAPSAQGSDSGSSKATKKKKANRQKDKKKKR
jgi:D-alanyl-D-alanine carboxypeptidase